MSMTVSGPMTGPPLVHRSFSLSRGGALALTIRMLGAGGILLSHIVLVRGLGVSAFGEYAEAVAWLQVLCVFGKMGYDNTSLRFVSEYVTNRNDGSLRAFVRHSTRSSIFAGSIAMASIIAVALIYWNSIGSRQACCMILTSLMIPLVSLRQIQEASLRGVGRMIESQLSTVVWPMTLFFLAFVVWRVSPTSLTSPVALFLHFLSVCAVSILVFYFLSKTSLSSRIETSEVACRRQWTSTATAFLIAELLIALKSRICVVIAGAFLGSDSAGLYAAMERFSDVSVLGSQSLGLVIAPQFAALFAAGRYADMQRLLRQGQFLGLAFAIPLAIGIACFGDYLFLLLGSSYRAGWSVLNLLLASACITAFASPAAYVLQMTGHERVLLRITATCAMTNVVLSLLLIWPFGIFGLGISQIVTSLIWTVGGRIALTGHQAWNPSEVGSSSSLDAESTEVLE